MTIGLRLFVVMTKLDEHIVTWLQSVENLLPSSLIDETLGTATIHSMIVNQYLVIEKSL